MNDVDYEKVKRINDAIDHIWNRIDRIDKLLNKVRDLPFCPAEVSRKDLLEERKQLFETYQKDLKELEKCYMEENK